MDRDKQFTIRQAVEKDAEGLQRYAAELFEEKLRVVFSRERAPTTDEQRDFIRRMKETPRSILLLAVNRESIVGMLDFHGHQKPQRAHAGAFGMSVSRKYRRAGVGSRLLQALLDWVPATGIKRIELEVLSNNPGAISLYEQLGFAYEGRQAEAVRVDGQFVDIILMAKIVPEVPVLSA